MALSLLYNPVDYSSAHGDLIFTLLEDTKPFDPNTYPDYKYVCDIYIGGSLVVRLKAIPRPDGRTGIFDIGSVVRNYLLTEFEPASNNPLAQKLGEDEFYVNAICQFGEEYGGVIYPDIIVDSERSYFNHYNGRMAGQFTILPARLDKTCTLRPDTSSVYRGAKFCFIPFLASDDTTVNLIVKTYNGNGLIQTATLPVSPTALSANELLIFNCSPTAFNAVSPGLISNYIDYYTVEFSTTNIIDDSIKQFNLVCESKFEVFTLHFLNRYGGFESKDFTKVSKKMLSAQKSDYGQSQYFVSTDGQPHWFNNSLAYREQKPVYAVGWTEKMTLNTDFLTDGEYGWLQDLILSPMVFIEMFNVFYPVNISDNNYEQKKAVNDDLTNLTLNIEFGERFNTQYR